MKMTAEQLNRLLYLCGALRDAVLTPAEFDELNAMLRDNVRAQEYYLDYVYMCTDLCNFQSAVRHPSVAGYPDDSATDPAITLDMLKVLAEYENQAETMIVPTPESQKVVLAKAHVEKVPHKVSKLSLVTFVTSLAAMLIMMTYVYLNPRTSYEVATITDTIQSQWSSSLPLQKGSRLLASAERIELQRGAIKFETDKGVQVILEAPAKFQFVSPDEVLLHYGRLYAVVSQSGNGFSVQTENSKIIDLGTKFGVYADMKGETELHMFKGNALLIAGQTQDPKKTSEVSSGQALRVDYTGQAVKDVPLREDVFIREMDSQTGLLWRGQKVINLADVVGGGNGLGTGSTDVGINPANGDFRKAETTTRRQSNGFVPVPSNVFVDGVFIPNGSKPQTVTSAGHLFAECPPTSGFFYSDIANTLSAVSSPNTSDQIPLFLGKTSYSQKENPSIFLHANAGVTFDLSCYRSRLPGVKIARFTTEVGISDSAPKNAIADSWVLVDGQVRYHNAEPMQRGKAPETITVDITDQDRFLTLVTTDGGVLYEGYDENRIGYDWCIFGRPVLIME